MEKRILLNWRLAMNLAVTLVDLDHDGVEDLLISIPSGGSGGITNYSLYTFKDFQLKELALPGSAYDYQSVSRSLSSFYYH